MKDVMIDAHHHFWAPARGDYGWMPEDDPVLSRPYGPADLAPALRAAGVQRSILVQAAPSVEETEYMLGIADSTDHVAGVVGWVNFEDPAHLSHLKRLSAHPAFLGVRPMIQDIPDVTWALRPELDWAFRALCDLGLRFDALGFPRHLGVFLDLAGRYPDLPMVLDHGMKPDIAGQDPAAFGVWADGMARLAGETGVFCKLSGLVTEAAPDWDVETLRPYVEHILASFGPDRVMWGSDWPVCRLRAEYGDWLAAAQALTVYLPDDSKAMLFGRAAARFYGLSDETK